MEVYLSPGPVIAMTKGDPGLELARFDGSESWLELDRPGGTSRGAPCSLS